MFCTSTLVLGVGNSGDGLLLLLLLGCSGERNHLVARSTFGGLGGTISVPGFNGTLSGFVCVRKIVHNGDDSTKHWNDEQLHFPQQ